MEVSAHTYLQPIIHSTLQQLMGNQWTQDKVYYRVQPGLLMGQAVRDSSLHLYPGLGSKGKRRPEQEKGDLDLGMEEYN